MQGSTSSLGNESGSRCGGSELSNADEEEDWDWVKRGDRGDCSILKAQSRKDYKHSIKPAMKALSPLRKRNFQWHRHSHHVRSGGFNSGISLIGNIGSSVSASLAVSTSILPPTTLSLELPIGSVLSETYLSETPTLPSIVTAVPTITDIIHTSTSSTTTNPYTSNTSFVSRFAPNATTSHRTHIITITTTQLANFTRTATTRSSNRTSTQTTSKTSSKTSLKTSSSSTSTETVALTTVIVYHEAPMPTIFNTPPAPTSSSDVSGSGDNGSPVQPKMLGGILGGIAGLGLMLFLILLLVKRHKRKLLLQAQDDAGYGGPLPSPNRSMVERSMSILGAAGLMPRYHRPTDDPEPQERGFVRVSGRKLHPVLGGPRPEYGSARSAGEVSSYYREDDNSYGATAAPDTPVSSHGPGRYSSPPTPSPAVRSAGGSSRLKEMFDSAGDEEVSRVGSPANLSRTPNRPPLYLRQLSLAGSDDVGRSLASRDGSKTSRFTEDVT